MPAYSPASRSFYTGVFLISGLLMALQIIQTRIFSVTTWYHISFLVVGLTMFGLTLGALKVHRGDEQEQRRRYREAMAQAALRFALGIVAALAGQMGIPIISEQPLLTLAALPAVVALSLPAYYYAGEFLSLAITRAPFPPARTYGADLVGAAAGCLFALLLMNAMDSPSAVLVLALLALGTVRFLDRKPERLPVIAAGLICLALAMNLVPERPLIYPLWVKKQAYPQSVLAYDRWNSISRIMIENEHAGARPYLWGPSSRMPDSVKTDWYLLLIDGDASTPITRWNGDTGNALHWLDYDVTTIAYAAPGLKSAGIIGLGGGRDVLTALHAGVRRVTAMDVNNIQVALLSKTEPFKTYAAIGGREGVTLVNSEARSWFESHPDTFDLIQMSLVDTWAANGAGAFTLTENGLYTVEAWKTFMSHLNPGGILTVSRWYRKDVQREGQRVLSLAMAALFEAGAKDPQKHIFAATTNRIITLALSRDDFTKAQLDAMEKRAKEMDFDVLLSPRKDVAGAEFAGLLHARDRAGLDAVADKSPFDIRPTTDWRPFFFNQVRIGNPARVLAVLSQPGNAMAGDARAIVNLYIIIGFSLWMVIFAILSPLYVETKARNPFIRAGTAWFVLIGLGFMLAEISLMQRMSVYLGHPAYGLGVILFSLVLSMGCGSLACSRFPLRTSRARMLWALGTAAAIGLSVVFIDQAMAAFAGVPLLCRAMICISVTAPLGLLMGYGFPTGIEMAREAHARSMAWFWGINGAAGVMGSSLAIAIDISAGIDKAMYLAALCYALLAVAAMSYQPARKRA